MNDQPMNDRPDPGTLPTFHDSRYSVGLASESGHATDPAELYPLAELLFHLHRPGQAAACDPPQCFITGFVVDIEDVRGLLHELTTLHEALTVLDNSADPIALFRHPDALQDAIEARMSMQRMHVAMAYGAARVPDTAADLDNDDDDPAPF